MCLGSFCWRGSSYIWSLYQAIYALNMDFRSNVLQLQLLRVCFRKLFKRTILQLAASPHANRHLSAGQSFSGPTLLSLYPVKKTAAVSPDMQRELAGQRKSRRECEWERERLACLLSLICPQLSSADTKLIDPHPLTDGGGWQIYSMWSYEFVPCGLWKVI